MKVKFRVWDDEEKIYRDGCKIDSAGIIESSWGKEKFQWIPEFFTGIYDKHGNEIYEGDIVQFSNPDNGNLYKSIVFFSDGAFFVKLEDNDWELCLYEIEQHIEVIQGRI